MLEYIDITDYALIGRCSLEFAPSFNVVTGESGAGKSILMAAAALLFGGRTDKNAIRTGCESATVAGGISVPETLREQIAEILAGQDIEFSGTAIDIRRKITLSGVRNYLNDVPVGAKTLAELGRILIDFHSANEQLALTNPARQLEMLDRFSDLEKEKNLCRLAWQEWESLRQERRKFESATLSDSRIAELRELVRDVEKVNPQIGEENALSGRYKLVSNARDVLQICGRLQNILAECDGSVVDQLGEVYRQIVDLSRIADDPGVDALLSDCSVLQENIRELASKVADFAEKTDLDAEALVVMESRLQALHSLKRRYQADEESLLEACENARQELAAVDDADKLRRKFAAEEKILQEKYFSAARDLSVKRRQGAEKLCNEILQVLAEIGFPECRLQSEFSETSPAADGIDGMQFVFCPNPGEAMLPLHKIASSGELSRVMLAFKTVLADADDIPTVVFDEIDMNIGGESANKVGILLRNLGRKRQILCISHLAQVASRADRHFCVSKKTDNGRTLSTINKLDDPVSELARMLGGGSAAERHAAELASLATRRN